MAKPDTVRDETGPQAAGRAAEDAPASSAVGPALDSESAPDKPTELGGGSWLAAGRRTIREFKEDFLQDRAAGLTYYGVLSIFPGILVLVSLLGLLGQSRTKSLTTNLTNAAPSTVRTILTNAIHNLQAGHGTASVLAEKWQGKPLNAPNDVVVHPDGGIWFTDFSKEHLGRLGRCSAGTGP